MVEMALKSKGGDKVMLCLLRSGVNLSIHTLNWLCVCVCICVFI